ncbi:MAG: phosphate acyltransferase PlsX [Burkholderiaceae bacterium]
MPVRIAIDSMGGDHGLSVTIPAALEAIERRSDVRILLVGDRAVLEAELSRSRHDRSRIEIVHASEVVTMDDSIEIALRKKRDSSMRVAITLIKEGRADACVSAGNTGALMAISRYVLKTVEGIDRPAIATLLPNQTGGATTMLDLGANVDCTAAHLLQFAMMGSALVAAVDGKERPSVGLLNIGEEIIKGNDTVKEAGELMRAAADRGQLNFHGNVEGNDIFKGCVDVVVCDGFVGNVALKTSEGLAQMLGGFIREEFTRNPFTYFAALVAMPVLKRFKHRVDHRRYNGASLLGLRGLVVKSHGSADAFAFGHAIARACDAAGHDVSSRIIASMKALRVEPAAPDGPAATMRSDETAGQVASQY